MPLRKFTTQFCTVKLKEKEKNEEKKGERERKGRQSKGRERGRQADKSNFSHLSRRCQKAPQQMITMKLLAIMMMMRGGRGVNCAGVSVLRNHKRQVASGKWQMPADAKYVNAFGWEIK